MARPTVAYDKKVLSNLIKSSRAYVITNNELKPILAKARCGRVTSNGQVKMDEDKDNTFNGE